MIDRPHNEEQGNPDPEGPHDLAHNEGMVPHLHHRESIDDHAHADHHVHVTPFWPMAITFGALLFLTLLTVVTAKGLYFGNAVNLVIALIIAGAKAVLVAAFFMHLVYDKALNTIIVVATMFAVVLFITLTTVDIGTRSMAEDIEAGEIVPGGGAQVSVDQESGQRTVSRIGTYRPWHTDTPSQSVLEIAREKYAAKKGHAGEDDADAKAESHSAAQDTAADAPESD